MLLSKFSPGLAARVILLGFACAASPPSLAVAQSPRWFSSNSADVASAVSSAPARSSVRPVAASQASPSDLVLEVAQEPDVGLAVVSHITDQVQPQPLPASQNQTPLLDTASMIGPMHGAERMFSRLDIDDELRGVATLAASGPRCNAEDYVWMPSAYTWISPVFYHRPLYFEQPNLERYGIGPARAVQPMLSSMHFFGTIPLIPYKALAQHPRERVYTLGQGRPGNCVPMQRGVILGTSSLGAAH